MHDTRGAGYCTRKVHHRTAAAPEHDGSAGVQPAWEASCLPIAPTEASAPAEGCGQPLNELEDQRMVEADEERDAVQVRSNALRCPFSSP